MIINLIKKITSIFIINGAKSLKNKRIFFIKLKSLFDIKYKKKTKASQILIKTHRNENESKIKSKIKVISAKN